MSDSSDYLIFSKSRSETSWDCARKEYLGYLWGGLGLKPVGTAFELEFGSIMHEAAAQLALPHMTARPASRTYLDAPLVFNEARTRMRALGATMAWDAERSGAWTCIMEGLLRAFHRVILPAILREFEVIDVEQPCLLPLIPEQHAWFVAKPDLILRSRITGKLWYWEHKSTGSDDAKWINSWTKAVQVHTGLKAAERLYGEPFDGCYVLGWYKGYHDRYNNIQVSPFSYGWFSPGAPGVMPDRYEYKEPQKWKGWERVAVANLVEGMAGWVSEMPDEIVHAQFIKTPPLLVREDLIERYLNQLRKHAYDIRIFQAKANHVENEAQALQILDEHFPQAFNKCEPSWGRYNCAMGEACWSSAVAADPVASGLYRKNDPNSAHRLEFITMIEGQAVPRERKL